MSSSSTNCKVSSSSPLNISYLPNDLLLNCLARLSRLYYPTLSLVSKRFRSLLASLQLSKTRKLLGCTESCLYLCLRSSPDSNSTCLFTLNQRTIQSDHVSNPNLNPRWFTPNPIPRWFTPCFAPGKVMVIRKKVRKNKLVSVPPRNSPLGTAGLIAVGDIIYKIGGYIDGVPLSMVFFMNCRSNAWQEGPSMKMATRCPLVSVLDGKIYVVEGHKDFSSTNLMECFDPKTQKWEDLPNPSAEIRGRYVDEILATKGNIYLFGDKDVVYKPKENTWDMIGWENALRRGLGPYCPSCVIDDVLYYSSYGSSGMIQWYDYEGRTWRVLKGLKKMHKLPRLDKCFKLVNNGGKIAVFWEEGFLPNEKTLWCAEISLERRKRKIFGKIEWCNAVLTVPKSCCYEQFIAAAI